MEDTETWTKISNLFNAVIELPPEKQKPFLRQHCGRNERLRKFIEKLVAAEKQAPEFLDEPAVSLRPPRLDKPLIPGTHLGHYQIIQQIGEGGMGVVYLAERADGEFEQRVAIKVLNYIRNRSDFHRRFQNERQILANLTHPNISRIHDGGSTPEGLPYFVMEYVDGEPLNHFAKRIDFRERMKLFQIICDAVFEAHQKLIVHCDLKPANILVTSTGNPVLLDFGIARLLDRETKAEKPPYSPLTPMSIDWASPEQKLGASVTTATDIYALGKILHELWTCEAVAGLPAPSRKDRDLDAILSKATQDDPSRRYASVEHLSEDIHRYFARLPLRARPNKLSYRIKKFVNRNFWSVVISFLAIVLLALFIVSLFLSQGKLQRERDRSRNVTEFLVEFLRSPDPHYAKGRDITVRESLDAGSSKLDTLRIDPATRAAILDSIGRVYMNLALYDEARPKLEEAIDERTKALGDSHYEVAESLHNMATLERYQGNTNEAESLMRRALQIQRDSFPTGHRDLARGIANLASLTLENQAFEEAAQLAQEALAMQEHLFGFEHLEIATTLNTLATIHKRAGKPSEAERLYRRSITIRRNNGDTPSPGLANTLANLATLLSKQNDQLQLALELHQEALDMKNLLYTNDHPYIVSSKNGLAMTKYRAGDPRIALRLLDEALAMQRRLDRNPSIRTAIILRNRAEVLKFLKRAKECALAAGTAVSILEEQKASRYLLEAEDLHMTCLSNRQSDVESNFP